MDGGHHPRDRGVPPGGQRPPAPHVRAPGAREGRPLRDLPRRGPLRALRPRASAIPVYRDSCVEALPPAEARPRVPELRDEAAGCPPRHHITDWRRTRRRPRGLPRGCPGTTAERVQVRSSPAGGRATRRSSAPVDWQLAFFVPTEVLEAYVGPIGPLARPDVAGELLQVRRRDLASALGRVVPGRRAELPSAPLLRHPPLRP
ncbi:MAG: hypothetical protein MZV64_11690 [Ignavibacteriales bacterium]|nr:hypothetical protein [Ignavibacteriales bacterium]